MSVIESSAKPALDFVGSASVTGTMRGVRRAALRSEMETVQDAHSIQDNFPNLYRMLCGKAEPEIVAHIAHTL